MRRKFAILFTICFLASGCDVFLYDVGDEGEQCLDDGKCNSSDLVCTHGICCKPYCDEEAECGPNGCGGYCGECDKFENSFCNESFKCDCNPSCTDRDCGPDGCGDSCGNCSGFGMCTDGKCDCYHESCGSTCCQEGDVCYQESCCTPDCTGLECGPDPVCQYECGPCVYPEICTSTGICSASECGDNQITGNEDCEPGDLDGETCLGLGYYGGQLACRTTNCKFDTTDCETYGWCGDDMKNGPEDCEGGDLGGQTCESLNYYGGFLYCNDDCTYDLASCQAAGWCGDRTINGGEECDYEDFGGLDCTDFGFHGGLIACADQCLRDLSGCNAEGFCGDNIINGPEDCEAGQLDGESCGSLGYYGGQLDCDQDCYFDTSDCELYGWCGDKTVNGGEDCDDTDLGVETCQSLDYYGGVIGCLGDCTYDLTDCASYGKCGDHAKNGPEYCDDQDLGGEDCASLGYYGTGLSCQANCTFELTSCEAGGWCGDGAKNGPEDCEGTNHGGEDCISLGYQSGNLGCNGDCTFDTSDCCGDGTISQNEECDDGNNVDWDGCTGCVITEFQIHGSIDNGQTYPDVVVQPNGSFVVVWTSDPLGTFDYEVYARRFDSFGNPVGDEFHVNTESQGSQLRPAVSMDGSGNFVVVWEDGNTGVWGQLYDSSGNPTGQNIHVSSSASHPDVAMKNDGSFVVVWVGPDTSENGIFGQRFDASGSPVGNQLSVFDWERAQSNPAVAIDQDGNFVVVFETYHLDTGSTWYEVFAHRYNSQGNSLGYFQVNTHTNNSQVSPAVDYDSSGNFTVVWQSQFQDGSDSGIYCTRFDSDGNPISAELSVNSYTDSVQGLPAVAVDSFGNFVVSWSSYGQDGSGHGIILQRYALSGIKDGSEFIANTYTDYDQSFSAIDMDGSGNYVVVWQSNEQDGSGTGIYAQRFKADGTPRGLLPW